MVRILVADPQEKNLLLGQEGLYIEQEQDPDAADGKVCTNAPDGALKHAVNVDYQGKPNLHRRKGYQDAFYNPDDGTYETHDSFDSAPPPPTSNDKTWQDVIDNTNGIRGLDRFTSIDGREDKQGEDGWELTLTFADITTSPYLGATLTQLNTGATMYVTSNSIATEQVTGQDLGTGTWDTVAANTVTGGGMVTNPAPAAPTAVAYSANDTTGQERYTIFATRDNTDFPDAAPNATTPLAETHTYHWRNPATPNIKQLELPIHDRTVFSGTTAGGDYTFSDVNVWGCRKARFWNYTSWARGGEAETYLLGTYGGHYKAPIAPPVPYLAGTNAVPPVAWNCGGFANRQPPAGSFDQTRANAGAYNYECIADTAIQRRVLIWFPDWFRWWDSINAPDATTWNYGAGNLIRTPEIGYSHWFAPFIWYHDPKTDDYDDFYAEPCGRYLEPYNESLFMARIERTYNSGDADDAAGTPTWIYEPSAIMWSFWGYATGMELGTPPAYPFRIPEEPNERVWGCGARGYPLNRHIYFRRGDGTPIVGMKEWNGSLYVMKPTGFGQITGTYSGNFGLMDLRMSQGPAGSFAWCKADEGIYYVTKKGFYLFDGNPASQNRCLSDLTVKKIFEDDIDWASATDFLSGEIVGVSLQWDKQNSQVIISYPKNGEQGGQNQPFGGTPTRCLVYDTLRGRFTEWDVPLVADNQATPTITQNVSWGMMLGGQDPTDDDYMMGTHPIGNYHGNNDDGRLLYRMNIGYRDNVELDSDGDPDADTGDRIIYDATTKDYAMGYLRAKQAVTRWRQVIYANNGGIKRKVIYNYYDDLEEEELTYPATGEDGYYQEEPMNYPSPDTGNSALFSVVSFKYYHDEDNHMTGEAIDTTNTNIYDGPIQFAAATIDLMPTEGDSAG